MIDIAATAPGRVANVRLAPGGLVFRCGPGQTLLSAALAAGIDLPYECASGSCGGCRARLIDGAVTALWADAPGLSERDRRKGDRILCCQSVAQGDCVIQVQPGAAPPPRPPAPLQARVRSLQPLNRDVVHLVLEAGQDVDFLPGQFMLFALPAAIGRRAYSMSNLPDGSGRLEFIIKRKPGGAGTAHLVDTLRAGDRVDLEGPYGRAWLRDAGSRDIVLLAGGSGLAPMWSIAQAALQRDGDGRVRLYFGANRAADLFWLEEFARLRSVRPGLEVNLVLANPSASDPEGCRHGLVGEVMAAELGAVLEDDLYMAGPPGLVDSVLRGFVGAGRARADRVFFDRFC